MTDKIIWYGILNSYSGELWRTGEGPARDFHLFATREDALRHAREEAGRYSLDLDESRVVGIQGFFVCSAGVHGEVLPLKGGRHETTREARRACQELNESTDGGYFVAAAWVTL